MGKDGSGRKRAVFLDRDGVINRNVWNPVTGRNEAPLTTEDFQLLPGVLPALAELQGAGYLLFVVSNQPNYAKGKSPIEDPSAIHRKLLKLTTEAGILFAGCYYCFHHPDGSDGSYAGSCLCRKPSPYFLLQARECFGIDMAGSWMIGDRESDVRCGIAAGARTVLIREFYSGDPAQAAVTSLAVPSSPDLTAAGLCEAVSHILAASKDAPGGERGAQTGAIRDRPFLSSAR